MSKGYIYNEDHDLEEVIDYSVDGRIEEFHCHRCKQDTAHILTGISTTRGEIFTCTQCGYEYHAGA
jgi:transposase-like protein